jgi:hypothetical protein
MNLDWLAPRDSADWALAALVALILAIGVSKIFLDE